MQSWNHGYQDTQNDYRARSRSEAVEKLGGRCCRCGFDDRRALQIDHVNGGGLHDRRTRGQHAPVRDILKDRNLGDYQLLCANCNWIKRAERQEHRRAVR